MSKRKRRWKKPMDMGQLGREADEALRRSNQIASAARTIREAEQTANRCGTMTPPSRRGPVHR